MTEGVPQAPIPSVSVNSNIKVPPKLVRIPSEISTVSTVTSEEEIGATFSGNLPFFSSSSKSVKSADLNLRQRRINPESNVDASVVRVRQIH